MIFQAKSSSIKFQIELQLQVGQALYITGNIPEDQETIKIIVDRRYIQYLGSYDDFHQFNQELEKEIDRRIPLVQVKDSYLIVKDKIGQNQGQNIVPSKNLVYLNIMYQKQIQFGEAFYVLQLQDGQPLHRQHIKTQMKLRVIFKNQVGYQIYRQQNPHNKQIQNWHYEIQKINQIDNIPDIEQPLYYESIFHNNEEIEVIHNNQPQEFAIKFYQKQSPAYDFFQFGAYPLLQNEYDDYQSEFMIPQSSFIQNQETITFRLKSITTGLFSNKLVQELLFDPSLNMSQMDKQKKRSNRNKKSKKTALLNLMDQPKKDKSQEQRKFKQNNDINNIKLSIQIISSMIAKLFRNIFIKNLPYAIEFEKLIRSCIGSNKVKPSIQISKM
ncbi:hypothetical protein pb186bvf_019739 [Paramecium bursaria]